MSDSFPAPETPHIEPAAAEPPVVDAPTPLARHADPSLPPVSAERGTPRGGSVEWVRPAELHRRTATKVASASLDLARRVVELRRRVVRTGMDHAREALAARAARLNGTQQSSAPAPDAPTREGPGL